MDTETWRWDGGYLLDATNETVLYAEQVPSAEECDLIAAAPRTKQERDMLLKAAEEFCTAYTDHLRGEEQARRKEIDSHWEQLHEVIKKCRS